MVSIIRTTGGFIITRIFYISSVVTVLLVVIAILVFITDSRQPVQESQATLSTVIAPQAVATFTPSSQQQLPTNTPTATHTPKPTRTPTATRTPKPTRIPLPIATATPTPLIYRVNNNANVRGGPGTNYTIVGNRQQGSLLTPLARTSDGEWIQIGNVEWIWKGLVDGNIAVVPVTHSIPPPPTATPKPLSTNTPQPTAQTQTAGRCSSDAALDYLVALWDLMDNTERAYGIIGDHYGLVSRHPDVVNNKDWIESTYGIVNILANLSLRLEELKPPNSLLELHALVIEVADKLLTAAAAISLSMSDDFSYLKVSSATLEEVLLDVSNMAVWIDNNC